MKTDNISDNSCLSPALSLTEVTYEIARQTDNMVMWKSRKGSTLGRMGGQHRRMIQREQHTALGGHLHSLQFVLQNL